MTTRQELLEAICRRDAIQADLDAAALEVSRKLYALAAESGESHSTLAALLGIKRQRVGQLIARAEKDAREAYERERYELARDAAADRELSARNAGAGLRGRLCGSCGRIKSRPSDPCDFCGNDPVTHNGDAREYDRAMGWE